MIARPKLPVISRSLNMLSCKKDIQVCQGSNEGKFNPSNHPGFVMPVPATEDLISVGSMTPAIASAIKFRP